MDGDGDGDQSGGRAALLRLIEKATATVDREVDRHLLRSIKSAVRSSDDGVRIAVGALMDKMKKEHSQVRYLALLIIDQLFMRSKLFRTLFVVNFDQFLSLSVGFRRNAPLPPPTSIASLLRSKSIEYLEKWNDAFGIHYRQIRLGFDYLKNTLKFQFPNRLENESRLQQERREREARSREILLSKFEKLKENFSLFRSEIISTLDQISECLDIIHTENGESNHEIIVEDDETIEFNSSALRQIRLNSLKEGTKISENSDNKAVFDTLRELYKLTVTKHLQSVQEGISVLVRVDLPDNRFRDSALKELIDTRNLIRRMLKRCEESGCDLSRVNIEETAQEDILWEEGKIEVYESNNSTSDLLTVNTSDGIISSKSKGEAPCDGEGLSAKSSKKGELETVVRSKLLAEAPVLNWGAVMDTWGSTRDVLANHRGLELENHWGRVDQDAVIPVGKISELTYHVTTYKEPAIEIKPCLAPLKSGGLCQRRDLRVCPFHGLIVPRDPEGNPLEERAAKASLRCEDADLEEGAANPARKCDGADLEERAAYVQAKCEDGEGSWTQYSTPIPGDNIAMSGDDLVKELAKQAVKNVRERESNMKELKKAKLAKVRQHNEAVLREAAIASTSSSAVFGENEACAVQSPPGIKAKKPTLASMLRKKVTAKDRLSQKFLSTRVTESTIRQLKQGEEARYREAYPNQW